MAPRTRRSQTIAEANHTQELSKDNRAPIQASTQRKRGTQNHIASRNINNKERGPNPPGSKKRTISSTDIPASSEVAEHATSNTPAPSASAHPSKRPRNAGPIHGRPMQLVLASEDRVVDQQDQLRASGRAAAKGKASGPDAPDELHQGSLLPSYPHANQLVDGSGGDASDISTSEALSDNTDVETEADWVDENHLAELAQKQPSKFEQAMQLERVSWNDASPSPDCSLEEMRTGVQGPPDKVGTSQEHDASTSLIPETSEPQWPEITNLRTVPGTNRVTLSVQAPLMRLVIQDAFEHVRASLLFNNAYPDATLSIAVVRGALVAAANSHRPAASTIHNRLLHDDPYLSQMSRLPRARIPLFRSEVKERCSTLVASKLSAIKSAPGISQMVQKQLMTYNYTFPSAPNRPGLSMRSRPYRDDRIIKIIRDLYFTGGSTSFSNRFHHLFPVFRDGTVWKHEVPIPMVALVATALYAALYEWRSGEHKGADFSTTSYLDVYNGHVGTFVYIQDNRNNAFHAMMADIYTQASDQPKMEATPGSAPGSAVAAIDLADLDD